ncbi:MAG: glycosyltransferase family 4 protein [Acidobacteria bacterium]|nr:glycosyltransferase family 4 protein [Acidobacteriota bacterium]MBI3426033.1 glycosyltransferase family 4 protein [Acidobacteriota bacterium]
MHIGIDAHAIGAQQGGNETYIKQLITALAEIDDTNRYSLYLANARAAVEWRTGFARAHPNFAIRQIPPPTPLVRVPLYLAYELRRRPVDVLHVQYTAPPFCPVPVVATIHDLAFEHLPETFTRRGAWQLQLTVRRTAQRAARIATVSEYSRQDLLRTYKLPPEKVAVTYNGIAAQFTPTPAMADEAAQVKARYGITRDFILTVGSLQPRKNLVRLIRAYAKLRAEQSNFTQQLVIVGRKLWLHHEIFAEVARQPWAADVILTGYVADEELPPLYRAAAVFAYPSIFEGFGLPPLEAMACGTPVVTSNNSCLPEIVGTAALLVDPFDEAAIANGLRRALQDATLQTQLRADGPRRAQRFTWREAAEKTLQLYQASFAEKHK